MSALGFIFTIFISTVFLSVNAATVAYIYRKENGGLARVLQLEPNSLNRQVVLDQPWQPQAFEAYRLKPKRPDNANLIAKEIYNGVKKQSVNNLAFGRLTELQSAPKLFQPRKPNALDLYAMELANDKAAKILHFNQNEANAGTNQQIYHPVRWLQGQQLLSPAPVAESSKSKIIKLKSTVSEPRKASIVIKPVSEDYKKDDGTDIELSTKNFVEVKDLVVHEYSGNGGQKNPHRQNVESDKKESNSWNNNIGLIQQEPFSERTIVNDKTDEENYDDDSGRKKAHRQNMKSNKKESNNMNENVGVNQHEPFNERNIGNDKININNHDDASDRKNNNDYKKAAKNDHTVHDGKGSGNKQKSEKNLHNNFHNAYSKTVSYGKGGSYAKDHPKTDGVELHNKGGNRVEKHPLSAKPKSYFSNYYGAKNFLDFDDKEIKDYLSKDHYAKGNADFDKEDYKGYFDEIDAKYKDLEKSHIHDQKFESGSKKNGAKSSSKANKGKKKYHYVKEYTTGYHNQWNKDEFKKDHDFYDDADKSGHFSKEGSEDEYHSHEKGSHEEKKKNGSSSDGGEHRSGEADKAKNDNDSSHHEYSKSKGDESAYKDDREFNNKEGGSRGKEYGHGSEEGEEEE